MDIIALVAAIAVCRGLKGRLAGESHPRATHSDAEVLRVRELHEGGWGYKRIARFLGVSAAWCQDICSFRRRPFVPIPVRSWPAQTNGIAEQLR